MSFRYSIIVFLAITVHADSNKAAQQIKIADDKKSIQYIDLISKVRDNHGSVYSACMNYMIKVSPTKADDELMLKAIKGYNHGYVLKLLLDDAKSANWDCTFGIWLTVFFILVLAAVLGGIIFKLITKCCVPSTVRFQSCVRF